MTIEIKLNSLTKMSNYSEDCGIHEDDFNLVREALATGHVETECPYCRGRGWVRSVVLNGVISESCGFCSGNGLVSTAEIEEHEAALT